MQPNFFLPRDLTTKNQTLNVTINQSDRFLSRRSKKPQSKKPQCVDLCIDTNCSSFNKGLYRFITDKSNFFTNLRPTQAKTMPMQARILSAPGIIDDNNINVLSWGDNNILAVAINNKLFLFNGFNGISTELLKFETGYITSVAWMPNTQCIAVGDSNRRIMIYDFERLSNIRSINSHSDRVSSLAWNNYVLSSGSRDASIIQNDMRMENCFAKYTGHTREVCGLEWNREGTLLASEGNDNKICLWGLAYNLPQLELHGHSSKALAWCPYDNHCLASGGTNNINIWDSVTEDCINSVDTGSQVCALEWSKHTNEIVSAQGYSLNKFTLWKSQNLRKVGDFTGHDGMVLCMTKNLDGTSVVSVGSDETLRFFYNVFEETSKTEFPQLEFGVM